MPTIPTAEAYTAAIAMLGLPADLSWSVEIRPRREKTGLHISRTGHLTVEVALANSVGQVAMFVAKKRDWIIKHTAAQPSGPLVKNLIDGESFLFLGREYRLLLTADSTPVRIEPAPRLSTAHPRLCLRRDLARDSTALQDWYAAEGRAWARERAQAWIPRLTIAPGLRFDVRDVGITRLGYYDPKEHGITLHTKLFQLPDALVEGVLVHELVHASRPPGTHHGEIFQRRLTTLMPDHRQRRKAIRTFGQLWLGDIAARST